MDDRASSTSSLRRRGPASAIVALAALTMLASLQAAGASPTRADGPAGRTAVIPPPLATPRTLADARLAAHAATTVGTATPGPSPWEALAHPYPGDATAMQLLTDGTVLVQGLCSNVWYRLTPDPSGSYADGTWSKIAPMPSGYGPLYDATAVLPDGRLLVEGGEYNLTNCETPTETDQGAIYDPVANTWTPVAAPSGWSEIGDAPSTVLANGTFMLGYIGLPIGSALFDAQDLTWSPTGTGKADPFSEEGLSLLGDDQVLTVDTQDAQNSELYTPTTGTWATAGSTPAALSLGEEIGPQLLLPTGDVVAFGATGSNAYFDPNAPTGTDPWSAAPSFPVLDGEQFAAADAPAAVLPDGDALVASSPFNGSAWQEPTHFFDLHGSTLTQVTDPANAASEYSYDVSMVVLPTGQVLVNSDGELELYTDPNAALPGLAPFDVTLKTNLLAPGATSTVSGRQLNGLTQDSAFGDDYQDATNFPLVKVVNDASKVVTFARTSAMTSMSVTAGLASSADFTLPGSTPLGASELSVGANGNWSAPTAVTIERPIVAAAVGSAGRLDEYVQAPGTTAFAPSLVATVGTPASAPVVTQTSSGTAIAVEGPSHSLDVYWNTGGAIWQLERPGAAGTTYSAPSITSTNGAITVVAQGPDGSLRAYVRAPGSTTFHGSQVAGARAAQSAPVVTQTSSGTAIAVEGPGHRLGVYWRAGSGAWHLEEPGAADSTYSAPSITSSRGSIWIAAIGPGGSLREYTRAEGTTAWHMAEVPTTRTVGTSPVVTQSSAGTAIAVVGPGHRLDVYWRAGAGAWHLEVPGPSDTTYSAPAITSSGATISVAAEGPGASLRYYVRAPGTTTWHELQVAGAGTTFSGPGLI